MGRWGGRDADGVALRQIISRPPLGFVQTHNDTKPAHAVISKIYIQLPRDLQRAQPHWTSGVLHLRQMPGDMDRERVVDGSGDSASCNIHPLIGN